MRIYCLDGIGTKGRVDGSVLAHCADHLGAKLGITPEWVPWHAAMLGVGGGGSWEENAAAGVDLLQRRVASHSEPVVLLAFSGGNKVVHDWLGQNPEYHHRVAAVGLMSDPWRPASRWQHGTADPRPRYGIMGQSLGPVSDRTFWTTAVDDAISSAWPDALLRYVADVSMESMDDLIRKAIHLGSLGQFQLAWQSGIVLREPLTWFLGLGGRIGQLAADVRGYMSGGHTNAYTRPYKTGDDTRSLAVRLADTIHYGLGARGHLPKG